MRTNKSPNLLFGFCAISPANLSGLFADRSFNDMIMNNGLTLLYTAVFFRELHTLNKRTNMLDGWDGTFGRINCEGVWMQWAET